MTGTVIKSTGSWYDIRDEKGTVYQARIKGKFRIQVSKYQLIAVGDVVDFEYKDNEATIITRIHERRNYIIRRSVNLFPNERILSPVILIKLFTGNA